MECIKFIEINNYDALINWIQFYRKINNLCSKCGKSKKNIIINLMTKQVQVRTYNFFLYI